MKKTCSFPAWLMSAGVMALASLPVRAQDPVRHLNINIDPNFMDLNRTLAKPGSPGTTWYISIEDLDPANAATFPSLTKPADQATDKNRVPLDKPSGTIKVTWVAPGIGLSRNNLNTLGASQAITPGLKYLLTFQPTGKALFNRVFQIYGKSFGSFMFHAYQEAPVGGVARFVLKCIGQCEYLPGTAKYQIKKDLLFLQQASDQPNANYDDLDLKPLYVQMKMGPVPSGKPAAVADDGFPEAP